MVWNPIQRTSQMETCLIERVHSTSLGANARGKCRKNLAVADGHPQQWGQIWDTAQSFGTRESECLHIPPTFNMWRIHREGRWGGSNRLSGLTSQSTSRLVNCLLQTQSQRPEDNIGGSSSQSIIRSMHESTIAIALRLSFENGHSLGVSGLTCKLTQSTAILREGLKSIWLYSTGLRLR